MLKFQNYVKYIKILGLNHEDQCINVRVRVVNGHAHILSQVRAFTTQVRGFVQGSS